MLQGVAPRELNVSSGTIEPIDGERFAVEHPSMRAELGAASRDAAEIEFVYRGPSRQAAPLASGELRRQIGLKLRAQDTCNVVYVMWHIEPSVGIEVSVKSNPGAHTHAECGDRGYSFLSSAEALASPGAVRPGDRHTLSASIDGDTLRAVADGRPVWVGRLPAAASALKGPVGLRSDNGSFEVALRASAPEGGR